MDSIRCFGCITVVVFSFNLGLSARRVLKNPPQGEHMTWLERIDIQRKAILCQTLELQELAGAMDRLAMPTAKELAKIAQGLNAAITEIDCALNAKVLQDLKASKVDVMVAKG